MVVAMATLAMCVLSSVSVQRRKNATGESWAGGVGGVGLGPTRKLKPFFLCVCVLIFFSVLVCKTTFCNYFICADIVFGKAISIILQQVTTQKCRFYLIVQGK